MSTNEDLLISSSASHSPRSFTQENMSEDKKCFQSMAQQQEKLKHEQQVQSFIENLHFPEMVFTRQMPLPGFAGAVAPQKVQI